MGLRFRSGVRTADTEYGTVLLDEHSGQYWQLNTTGARVVRTMVDGGTESDAITALVDEFDVDESQAREDVETLLTGLRSAGLVTP